MGAFTSYMGLPIILFYKQIEVLHRAIRHPMCEYRKSWKGLDVTDYRSKLSTRSITHLCWCNWRTFWRKNAAGRSPRGSCSCMTIPWLTRHLQPRRNWPTWASSVLITLPILRIWPRRTTTCSLDWKTIERSPFFFRRGGHCCRGDLVGRTTFCFFFEWLAKVRATD